MKKILVVIFFAILYQNGLAQSCTLADEYKALLALYDSTGGAGWANKDGWSNADTTVQNVQGWYGVSTDTDGHVIALNLSSNNLQGVLPVEIGNLCYLQILNFHENQLTGILPNEIGMLDSLQTLNLSKNQLTGSIPNSIGNLDKLILVDLSENQFSGTLPSDIGRLNQLQTLNINNNTIEGDIPYSFGNLTALVRFNAFSNLISSIPSSINGLSSIQFLYLDSNKLTTFPSEITDLETLQEIRLGSNSIAGELPQTIGNLVNLQILHIEENQLTGSIPTSIGNLGNLTQLLLFSNNFTGTLPKEIGNLINLTNLDIHENKLSGAIPSDIGRLTNLTVFNGSSNQFTSVPSEIGNLTALTVINLGTNQISGNFPVLHSQVNQLFLNNNKLTFLSLLPIKQNFSGSNFTYLQQDLIDSEILVSFTSGGTAVLNTSIDHSTSPSCLYQWFKSVNGVVTPLTSSPSATGNSFTLSNLKQTDNGTSYYYQITNPLIPDLVLTSRLRTLNFQTALCQNSLADEYQALLNLYNATNGSKWLNNSGWKDADPNVVKSVAEWYGIQVDVSGHVINLDLSSNNLEGALPSNIGNLCTITQLNLGGNKINGIIPEGIGMLKNIKVINLAYNRLTGQLPSSMGGLQELASFSINNNQISGLIPKTFSSLSKLTSLHLESNKITGPLDFVSNLSGLTEIAINDNLFYGNIPQLGGLVNLQSILAQNNTLESISSDILDLHFLTVANFSNNILNDIPDFSIQVNKPNLDLSLDGNDLNFTQLLPIVNGNGFKSLSYQPQNKVDEIKNVQVVDQSLILIATVDQSTNPASVYQWFKIVNGESISISNSSSANYILTISPITQEDIGVGYYYTITNPALPGLTLVSELQTSFMNTFCSNIYCFNNGAVGINTQFVSTGYRLGLKGKMIVTGARVALNRSWPDYVFDSSYKLPSLTSLKTYINSHKHLPDVPSAQEIKDNGMDIGEMSTILLKKTEELSLYFIQLDERLRKLESDANK